jgi:predicted amidohydrolase
MEKANRITVALAQLNSELADNGANLRRAQDYIARAARDGADLVMFPELYLQGYRADDRFADCAEPIPGPSTQALVDAAREHRIHIIMGMARLETSYPHCVYNSLCFVAPEGLLGFYDKIHLGTFHPFTEGVYFAPGRHTPVFDTNLGAASLQICYDASFPELTRLYAMKGSLVNLVISAGPSEARESWEITLRQRSKENAMPSVYCNAVGRQKDFSFFGGSKIINAYGRVVSEAKFDEEDFLIGTVDIEEALLLRRRKLPFRDCRPEIFEELAAVTRQRDRA